MREDTYIVAGGKTRIRPFFRSDVDRWLDWPDHPDPLFAIHNPRRMPGWMRAVWYRDLVDRQRQRPFAVDCLDGTMIGRIFLRHVESSARSAILGIDFHPQFIGRGYGSDALRAFLEYYFGEAGFRQLLLTVAAYNHRARKAYQGCGFQSLGTHWARHDGRVRRLLADPAYAGVRDCFRATPEGLEALFEDMVLTVGRFQRLRRSESTEGRAPGRNETDALGG